MLMLKYICIHFVDVDCLLIFFVAFTDQVLKTALSLYMEDKSLPLPTFEEILICTTTTTSEEVRIKEHKFEPT